MPPTASITFFASLLVVAAACALNRLCWQASRVKAADEAVWVARHSGYRFNGDAQVLHWLDDADGLVMAAPLVPGGGVWALQLRSNAYAPAHWV